MNKYAAAVVALIFPLGGFATAAGEGWEEKSAGTVVVRFEPGLEYEAEMFLKCAAEEMETVSSFLMLPPPERMTVLIPRADRYREYTGAKRGEWSAAAAFSGTSTIVVNPARVDVLNDPASLIGHEAVHLLLGRLDTGPGRRIPAWFQEGTAQILSGSLFSGNRSQFLTGAGLGRLPPLSTFEMSFPEEGASAALAYGMSESFVEFLRSAYACSPGSIAAAMANGADFGEAFRNCTGTTPELAEKAWLGELAKGPVWPISLLMDDPGLFMIFLFAAGALLAAAGFARYRVKRRAILRKMDDEEEWSGK